MRSLSSIQILRAVAALAVLMFHAFQWSNLDFAVGAAGVDLFFLISGFVLWLSADRAPVSAGAFLWARATRVAPLYWLWTLIAAAMAARWPKMMPVVHLDLRHALLSLAFVPHLDPWRGPFPLLPSGWTLTYEAFFYLVFAFALLRSREDRFRILAVGLTTAAVIGFGYHSWYTLLANPLLLEFLAGAAMARVWRRQGLSAPPAAAVAAIGAGMAALGAQQALGVRSDFWRPILFGIPAFLILWGALAMEGAIVGVLARGMERLGDASYSLYLSHLPVTAVVLAATPGLAAPLRVALTVPPALAVGLLCHRYVEGPLTRGLRRRWRPALAEPAPAGV